MNGMTLPLVGSSARPVGLRRFVLSVNPTGLTIPFSRGSCKLSALLITEGVVGKITLPKILTPALIKAVAQNVQRAFDEWLTAERAHARSSLLTELQSNYERINDVYKEALDRAEREGVPLDD
jgi:hypothetical protein